MYHVRSMRRRAAVLLVRKARWNISYDGQGIERATSILWLCMPNAAILALLYVPLTLLEICCAYTFNTHRSRLLTRPLAILLQLLDSSAVGLVLLPLHIVSTNTDHHQHLVPPPARYLRDPFVSHKHDKSVSGRPG
jgi:hypothetical protein